MNKVFEYLSVSDSDLGKTCIDKIKNGWEIEFVAPEQIETFGLANTKYMISSYKVLVSKEKTE